MPRFIDITGKRFNRLTVVKTVGPINGEHHWLCNCDCGNTATIRSYAIRTGKTKSCGCFCREATARAKKTHGMTKTPENNVWSGIKNRCYNKNGTSYANYGGRGITVCDRWFHSFQNFFDDMGPRPTIYHSIERIDNNGPYSPDNCKWATSIEQANNKRNNKSITIGNKTKHISQWAREFNVSPSTLRKRIHLGWDAMEALTKPIDHRYSRTEKRIRCQK